LYDFNNILKTKKIKSIPDPVSDDEYFEKSSNGPITQAIFNLDANHKINTANLHGLIIVLSKSILKKYKYIIANSYGGKQFSPFMEGTSKTNFRKFNNINKFITYVKNDGVLNFFNEVSFNDNILIEHIKEIWIYDTLFIYNVKTKSYKPNEVQKNNIKLFNTITKLLETYKMKIPIKIIDNIPKPDFVECLN
jgi:hypothetical protein